MVYLQNHLNKTSGNLRLLAKCFKDVLQTRPFYVLVSKSSNRHTHLSKNKVVGKAHPAPAAVLSVTDTTYTKVDEDVDIPEEGGMKSEDKAPDADWTSSINIGEEYELQQNKIIQMLSEYADMLDGHLGTIRDVKCKIELELDARPFHHVSYRSGKKVCEWEKKKVMKMLSEGVIEPSSAEKASPVVIALKKDGSWRFCVDSRKLNAVTFCDSYLIPRMDAFIDSLGDARVYSTLDASWGYS